MGEEQVGQVPGAERAPWFNPWDEQGHTHYRNLKEVNWMEQKESQGEKNEVRLDRWVVAWPYKALPLTKGMLWKGLSGQMCGSRIVGLGAWRRKLHGEDP